MPDQTIETSPPRAAGEKDLESLRQAWKAIGLCTEPADRRKAEAAIRKAYAAAGLAEPGRVVWCGSPFAQGIARAIVLAPSFVEEVIRATWKNTTKPGGHEFRNNVADCFRSSMRLFDTASTKRELLEGIKRDVSATLSERTSEAMPAPVRSALSDTVWKQIWSSVWDSVEPCLGRAFEEGMRKTVQSGQRSSYEACMREAMKDCIGDCVKADVWEGVMDTAWTNIRNSIACQVRVQAYEGLWRSLQIGIWENIATRIGEAIKASGNDSAQCSGYGQHDAYWLAFYAYFREAHGLQTETEPVLGLLELAGAGGWFLPHAKVCWISERPNVLRLDEQGRLCPDGQALAYPDGWGLGVAASAMAPVLQPA